MSTYSVPHFYRYYRTHDPPASSSQQPSSDRGPLARPSLALTSDGMDSDFSDSGQFGSPLSSPDSALKKKWPGTTTTSCSDSEF
ncbi:hypothetical protein BR93DRAFT_931709 [Coniochaeta sp. PMI_546]|nr:hypothetical protein BR93DRAFT_931709 [Coniochaeta sp. PMI_546]